MQPASGLGQHAGEHVIEPVNHVIDGLTSASSVHRYHHQQPAAAAAAAAVLSHAAGHRLCNF